MFFQETRVDQMLRVFIIGATTGNGVRFDRLSALLDHPRGTRMPSVAIYGNSGMGKTMIMKRSAYRCW